MSQNQAQRDSPPIPVGEFGSREGTGGRVTGPEAGGRPEEQRAGSGCQSEVLSPATPNQGVQATAASVRSCLAPAASRA